MKIWAKIIFDEKIIKNKIFNIDDKFSLDNFEDYLTEICADFDIPRPITLYKHLHHFNDFNITIYNKSDFIEWIDFDKLVLEAVLDDNDKSKI